jgi:hypothetical protein
MKEIKKLNIYLDICKRVSASRILLERGDVLGVMEKVQYDIAFLKQWVQKGKGISLSFWTQNLQLLTSYSENLFKD